MSADRLLKSDRPRGQARVLCALGVAVCVFFAVVVVYLFSLSPRRSRLRVARSLTVGMTVSEVRAKLGQPEAVTSAAGVEGQYHVKLDVDSTAEVWVYPLRDLGLQILFVAFDEEGRVTSYQVD